MTLSSSGTALNPSLSRNLRFDLSRSEIANTNNGVPQHRLNPSLERNPTHDSRDLWQDFHSPSSAQKPIEEKLIDNLGINPYAFGVFGIFGVGLALALFVIDRFRMGRMNKEIDKYKHQQPNSNKKV